MVNSNIIIKSIQHDFCVLNLEGDNSQDTIILCLYMLAYTLYHYVTWWENTALYFCHQVHGSDCTKRCVFGYKLTEGTDIVNGSYAKNFQRKIDYVSCA